MRPRHFCCMLPRIVQCWGLLLTLILLPHLGSAQTLSEMVEDVLPQWERQHQEFYAGAAWMVLSTPHFNAFREAGQSNLMAFAEWWPEERWGLRGFAAQQRYRRFGENGEEVTLRHLGLIGKGWVLLSDHWQASAGAGVATTRLEALGGDKQALTLVTEFLLTTQVGEALSLEFGTLTMDGASGEGSDDQRLGSTNYVAGLSVGF